MNFWRGIDEKLQEETRNFWQSKIGQDIINCEKGGHKQFQVCVRNNYFNVYWRGCSVLKYQPNAIKHVHTIHHKYLKESGNNTYINLIHENDDLVCSPDNKDLTCLEPRWRFRDKILAHAKKGEIPVVVKYAGEDIAEKKSLANYLERAKPCWLDLEIAFSREKEKDKVIKRTTVADRIDLAGIKMINGTPTLRFVEVKVVSDPRLRAIHDPEIFGQMIRYKKFIKEQTAITGNKSGLLKSYKTLAQNMLDLGLIHNDIDLVRLFVQEGKIDDYPHLLIIGDKSDLEIGRHGNHWKKLCEWANRYDFPEPTLFKDTCSNDNCL